MRRISLSDDVSILSCGESGKEAGLGYSFLVEEPCSELVREESTVEFIIASLEEQAKP
jgi:hypothetical protein